MSLDRIRLDAVLDGLSAPATRAAAVAQLAGSMGCDDVLLFASDPELGEMLPAPGLPQTPEPAGAWRAFIDTCRRTGAASDDIPDNTGATRHVRGICMRDVLAVAVGGDVRDADLETLRPFLPLLGALFRGERQMQTREKELQQQTAELEALNLELEVRTEEAESANRAKSEFLATMSHELRTPINAVLGYTELLSMGIAGAVTSTQKLQLERIRASGRHLLSVINDVLDMAKIEAGHMSVVSRSERVGEAVEDALSLLTLQAEHRRVSLEAACGDLAATYYGDGERVRQILINLLSNAVKFTEANGRVTVRCNRVEVASPATGLTRSGPWTTVEVEDTGIGMEPAELERVFRPFEQAESGHSRAHGGTGLGLTISRQLARLMGGDLTARSERGRGSTFTLWLPTHEGASGELDPSLRVRTKTGAQR